MWLRVLTGADAGRVVEVRGPRFTVGASADCDLVLRDAGVAPRHATFEVQPDGRLVISDLGSGAGTFVATRRIRDSVRLVGNEELCFGGTFAELSPVRARRSRRGLLVAAAGAVLLVVPAVAGIAVIAASGDDADGLGTVAGASLTLAGGPTTSQGGAGGATIAEAGSDEVGSAETADADAGGETEQATTVESADTQPPETDAAETEPFAGGSQEKVVFEDDFSDKGSGWEIFEGPAASAGYARGSFLISVRDSSFYATSTSNRRFPRPTVTVTAEVPSGTSKAGLGVLCRYRNESNFDLLALGLDGTVAIMRARRGTLRVVSGGGEWVRSDAVPVGARRYSLRAECGSEQLQLFVNGRLAASTRLAGRGGQIGLFVAGEAAIRFDDVAVAGFAEAEG